jgi:DNA-binding MarR family transcriptional regulator
MTRYTTGPMGSERPIRDTSFDLTSNVNYLLRRAHQRADELFAEAMTGLHVTPRQAALLFVIGRYQGSSLSELSRSSGIDRGTISEMVPRLERRGLLVQRKAENDGRAKSLVLTAEGDRLVRDVIVRTEGLQRRVLHLLPVEYHQLLVKTLRQIIGLEVETRKPGGAA